MKDYVNFAVEKTTALLAIDSPTGYTRAAEDFVLAEFGALGYPASRTNKGGILIDLGGEDRDDALLLEAHADTLGGTALRGAAVHAFDYCAFIGLFAVTAAIDGDLGGYAV